MIIVHAIMAAVRKPVKKINSLVKHRIFKNAASKIATWKSHVGEEER